MEALRIQFQAGYFFSLRIFQGTGERLTMPTISSPTIQCCDSGVLYRYPKPHIHSVHAYFPSVAVMDNGELLATFVLGEAFESTDSRTHVARSRDDGKSWELETMLPHGGISEFSSNYSRITAFPGGEVVVFTISHDRDQYAEEGLANPDTMGFVPTNLYLVRSYDYGVTWERPELMETSMQGSPFEICAPITPLSDGTWVIPSSTWPCWDGELPNPLQMLAFVSTDGGKTWPQHWDVMRDDEQNILYWESKIVELSEGRLLAVAWAYDREAAQDLPNVYAFSDDGGKTWSSPASTGLQGQTLTPLVLEDGRILSVYRRIDKPGLWVNISRLEGDTWINESEEPLWGHTQAGLTSSGADMVHNFNVLRFGAPCVAQLANGDIYVAFWCYEDCVSNIRWLKLRVS
jgi:sialidase-1